MPKHPENKYYILGRLKMILQKMKLRFRLADRPEDLRTTVLKSYSYALRDAKEYINITIDQFYEHSNKWPTYEEELFLKNDLSNFYQSWNSEAAYCNICCNIINQHREISNFEAIASYFTKEGKYIDYGCGTGALSLGLFLESKLKGTLLLLDVSNDINKFVEYRIKKNNLQEFVQFLNVLNYFEPDNADGIICIDVLEHLENPSEIFINKIYPLLKIGGLIYLRAPWRGQLTHIDQAADDFYLNGGRKFLSEKYVEIYRISSIDISCVYKKVRL